MSKLIDFYVEGNTVKKEISLFASHDASRDNFRKSKKGYWLFTISEDFYTTNMLDVIERCKRIVIKNYKYYLIIYREKNTKYISNKLYHVIIKAVDRNQAKKIFKENNKDNVTIVIVKSVSQSKITFIEENEEPFNLIGYEELKSAYDYANKQNRNFYFKTKIAGDFDYSFSYLNIYELKLDTSLI